PPALWRSRSLVRSRWSAARTINDYAPNSSQRLRQEAVTPSDRRGLSTTARTELGQHVGDVHAHGLDADEQLLADLAVRTSPRAEAGDLGCARRQRGGAGRAGLTGRTSDIVELA